MDVASLALCKELYKLSGWEYVSHQHLSPYDDEHPVYDLGYLLRKLPFRVSTDKAWFYLRVNKSERFYSVFYDSDAYGVALNKAGSEIACAALTPEDAACSLAIRLFKEGIL